MKKEYLKPTIAITTVETESLMAGSFNFKDDNSTGSGKMNDVDAQGPALSNGHKFDLWDIDE